MSRFDDYLRDIPMEIGERFYPRPEILLPSCALPRLPDMNRKHDFKVELRARQAYDSRNDKEEEAISKSTSCVVEATPSSTLAPSASTSSLPSTLEVLQPSRPEPSTTASVATAVDAPRPVVSFEEFEAKGTVFDELEWRSIDNRQALSQILDGISLSEPTTPNPAPLKQPATSGVTLPYPTLNFSSTPSTTISNSAVTLNGKNVTAAYSKPETPSITTASTTKTAPSTTSASTSQSSKVSLRQRLLTKGYRENLVNAAMAKVPHERVVHIEYYMKGMSILEKRGVNVDSSLSFLLDCAVTDKQAVLQRAQTADQLLSMGFDSTKVFRALLASEGDRLKALETILQS